MFKTENNYFPFYGNMFAYLSEQAFFLRVKQEYLYC